MKPSNRSPEQAVKPPERGIFKLQLKRCLSGMTKVLLSLLGAEECARLLSVVPSALFFSSFPSQFSNVAGVKITAVTGGNPPLFLAKESVSAPTSQYCACFMFTMDKV